MKIKFTYAQIAFIANRLRKGDQIADVAEKLLPQFVSSVDPRHHLSKFGKIISALQALTSAYRNPVAWAMKQSRTGQQAMAPE